MGKQHGRRHEKGPADNDKDPVGGKGLFQQHYRRLTQLQVVIVVGDGQGVGLKDTEKKEKKEAATGYEEEVAKYELALKILFYKKISSFIILCHS